MLAFCHFREKMCGIAGFFSLNTLPKNETVYSALSILKSRGPDSSQHIHFQYGVLLHTRLSIVDLTSNANQPFTNDGILFIVFNGEIYNHRALRRQLESEYEFISHSDTEVILNAYKKWGKACLNELDGMYAFAIYDIQKNQVFCSRDELGKKPFYYSHGKDFFVFGSTIEAIKTLLPGKFDLSIKGVTQFLSLGYTLSPDTIYKRIFQINPGSYLFLNVLENTIKTGIFFDLKSIVKEDKAIKYQEAVEEVYRLINKAVAKRISTDTECGILLSGGIDSTIIAAISVKQKIVQKSFTIGFSNDNYDELKDAKITAKALQIKSKSRILSQKNLDYIMEQVDKMDHPIADNSLLSFWELSALASENVKVVLSGDGADELFAGYPTLKADYLNSKLPVILHLLKRMMPLISFANDGVGLKTKLIRLIKGTDEDFRIGHYNWRILFSQKEIIELLGEEYSDEVEAANPEKQFLNLYSDVKHLSHVKQHLYVDMKTWLSDNILTKIDRGSMRFGLEVRSPFLDNDLIKFCCSLPAEYLFSPFKTKQLLRDAFETEIGYLLKGKRKKGFNTPVAEWVKVNDDEFKFYTKLIYNNKIKPQL